MANVDARITRPTENLLHLMRNLAHDRDLMFDQRCAAAYPRKNYGDDRDLQ